MDGTTWPAATSLPERGSPEPGAPAVEWRPAPPRPSARPTRRAGAVVGAGIAAAFGLACVPLDLGLEASITALVPAVLGGWLLGPSVEGPGRPGLVVLGFATFAVLVGAVVLAALMATTSVLAGPVDLAAGGAAILADPGAAVGSGLAAIATILVLAIFGVVIYGLPALALTTVCALIWSAIVARLAPRVPGPTGR